MTTQPNTLPALALQALLASSRLHLASLLRRATKAATALAAAFGLMAASVAAHATVVNAVFTNLGGGNYYLAEFAVKNDGAPASISGFTIYFDETQYSNLSLAASPSTWDSLLIQPDLGLPAAGFLDALVLNPLNALLLGQTQSGFNVTFDYLGQSLPGALPFDINDSNFNILFSGVTTTVPGAPTGGQIPEPEAFWLMLLAAGCLAATRVKWTARQAAAPAQSAAFMQEAA